MTDPTRTNTDDDYPDGDARLAVRWQAFGSPRVGMLPTMVVGAPNGPTVLVLTAEGSQDDGAASVDLVIGNGPPTADRLEHVGQVVTFLRHIADAFEQSADVCARALEDHLADLDLAEADALHRIAVAQAEPPC